MITIEKLKIYEEFGGDDDMYSRGKSKEVSSSEWALIVDLRHNIFLVEKGLTSREFKQKLEADLKANCENEDVISYFRESVRKDWQNNEHHTNFMTEKGRLAASLGYLTPVGWIIGLVIHLTAVIIFLLQFGFLYVPVIGKPAGLLLILAGVIWLCFWGAGLVFAFSGQVQMLPFFGKASQRIFSGIK